jgi:hypothetical protein
VDGEWVVDARQRSSHHNGATRRVSGAASVLQVYNQDGAGCESSPLLSWSGPLGMTAAGPWCCRGPAFAMITARTARYDFAAVVGHFADAHALPPWASSSQQDSSSTHFATGVVSTAVSQQHVSPQQAGLQHSSRHGAPLQQVLPQQPSVTLAAFGFMMTAPPATLARANAPTMPRTARRFMFFLHTRDLKMAAGTTRAARSLPHRGGRRLPVSTDGLPHPRRWGIMLALCVPALRRQGTLGAPRTHKDRAPHSRDALRSVVWNCGGTAGIAADGRPTIVTRDKTHHAH